LGFAWLFPFLVCAWLLVKELKRKQAAGYFTYKETAIEVGKPAGIDELLINFFFGLFWDIKCWVFLLLKALSMTPRNSSFLPQEVFLQAHYWIILCRS
jgi:hypothetical protein